MVVFILSDVEWATELSAGLFGFEFTVVMVCLKLIAGCLLAELIPLLLLLEAIVGLVSLEADNLLVNFLGTLGDRFWRSSFKSKPIDT